MEFLKVAFPALGAVIGLFFGGAVGSFLVPAQKDVLPVAAGALVGALLFAWIGVRIAMRLDRTPRASKAG